MNSKGFQRALGMNVLGRAVGYKVDPAALVKHLGHTDLADPDRLRQNTELIHSIGKAIVSQQPSLAARQPKRFWVVVKVEAGIPVMVDAFLDKRSAGKREQFLRQHMNPQRDEVGLFSVPSPFK